MNDSSFRIPLRERKYDLVLLGATGYTGTLISHHLCESVPKSFKWAITGRSAEKLERLHRDLRRTDEDYRLPDVLDFDDYSPAYVIQNTKVLLSVVAPATYNAERFLRACVEEGTAWLDLTGEVPWIRKMIERYGDRARETGAIIIPSCGYDSIPSDIGLFLLAKQMNGNLTRVQAVFEDAQHSTPSSAGSISSILAYFDEYDYEDEIGGSSGFLKDPYYLFPDPHKYNLPPQSTDKDVRRVTPNTFYYNEDKNPHGPLSDAAGGYIATQGMVEATNRSIVCRTVGLISENKISEPYGDHLDYREYLLLPPGPLSHFTADKVSQFLHTTLPWALSHVTVRTAAKLFVRFFMGENSGPADEAHKLGSFRMRMIGERESDSRRGYISITGHSDPGYGWTSLTIAETAIYLARKIRGDGFQQDLDGNPLMGLPPDTGDMVFRGTSEGKGGFWTPASLGLGLARWLERREVVELETGWVDEEI